MNCVSCQSKNLAEFTAEISIHFHGLHNVGDPDVMVFPKLLVCLDCGSSQFSLPEGELRLLRESRAA
jgi:hypothetical protein